MRLPIRFSLMLTPILIIFASGRIFAASSLNASSDNPQLKASLITCYPGPEVYELVGHEAIRIKGTDANGAEIDSVWNYGVFDFNSPGFLVRFVKGETDYMVWGYPYKFFQPQYMARGSRLVEQDLNLSEEETARLRRLLQINALPANRTYRYNYVRDNCSTRVVAMIDSAVYPRKILYPDSIVFPTFRTAMRHYHANYPWYQFGIDLALGSGIDMPINSRMETFAPLRLMEMASEARFDDGSPLLSNETILFDCSPSPVLAPTPWYLTPLTVCSVIFLISLLIAIREWLTGRAIRWWMSLFFSVLGLTGCIIWFLVFFSTHDSTSPNLMCLWLNPLQLTLALCIWWRATQPIAAAMAVVNVLIILFLSIFWPFQSQSANPAIFPLWGAVMALSAAYIRIYPQLKHEDYRYLKS